MGYILTRRYVINASDTTDLVDAALQYVVEDPETSEYIETAIQEGWGDVAAATILAHAQDIGDMTEMVKVLDEQLTKADPRMTEVYFT